MGSPSTHIVAFVPDTDATYQKHLRILTMCQDEGVSLPLETEYYFKGCDQPEDKIRVKLQKNIHYKEWNADMQEGFEVDLTKLPEGVTRIRFYNSY